MQSLNCGLTYNEDPNTTIIVGRAIYEAAMSCTAALIVGVVNPIIPILCITVPSIVSQCLFKFTQLGNDSNHRKGIMWIASIASIIALMILSASLGQFLGFCVTIVVLGTIAYYITAAYFPTINKCLFES